MAYDIIGDVHGCHDELLELLGLLGYRVTSAGHAVAAIAPPGRTAVFVGDLVNRGPDTPGVLRLVMDMVASRAALAVVGNHDVELARMLRDPAAAPRDRVDASVAQMQSQPEDFRRRAVAFIEALPRRLRLDEGRLIVAHAGLPLEYHDDASSQEADDFAVNGREISDANGRPVRYRWAEDYRGAATVVYGHYSSAQVQSVNGAICIDTGCVYGGSLTAMRYPEGDFVSVPARRVYYESARSAEFRAAAQARGR